MHPHRCQPAAPVHEMAEGVHSLHTNHLEPPALRAGGGGRKFPPAARLTARRQEFEELRQLWQRPYGTNEAKALAAFNRVTGDGEVTPAAHSRKRTALGGGERASLPAAAGAVAGQRRMAKRSAGPTKQRSPQTKRRRGGRQPGARQKEVDGDEPPKDKPHGNGEAPTAVTKLPPPWPTQQKVKDLAAELDRHYRLLEAMVKVSEKLSEANDYTRKQIIQEAERVMKSLERIGAQVQERTHAKRMG